MTQCSQQTFDFHQLGRREVVGCFDGGIITSDAGGLLLKHTEQQRKIVERFARCFTDHRDRDATEHSVEELVAQRVYGLALGYEDLVDHDDLRSNPLLASIVGKIDPTGKKRRRKRDRGKPLAGKSTLNRLELTRVGASSKSRYKKIVCNGRQVEDFFVEVFLNAFEKPPKEIILDFDATDDPVHGDQLGRFFHGYYKCYCFLPLYVFCGDHLLAARLRPSDIDGSADTLRELARIVPQIRKRWPKVRIILRADSGFCRDHIMRWCEKHDVFYVLGLAKNSRLEPQIQSHAEDARRQFEQTGKPVRIFADFKYQTLDTWSHERRVIAKAEHLAKGANPRFVVTSFPDEHLGARKIYEDTYCARGECENRIKEQQLYLFADRTSSETMRPNQLRLWFSSVAYVLMNELRRLGLQGTAMENAQCQTIRLKLLKIGALVRVTARQVWVSMTSACPYQEIFATAWENLRVEGPLSPRLHGLPSG